MISTGDEAKGTEWKKDQIDRLENELNEIETTLKNHLESLEKSIQADDEKEAPSEPPEVASSGESPPLLQTTQRIISSLKRCATAECVVRQQNDQLKNQLKNQQFALEEIEMERDVLLQQVHAYLETNSSLRVRLEEQRCQRGALQRQLNAKLELRVKALEIDKEELTDLNLEKDKQIHKMNAMLEQTANCLKNKETEVLNWKTEENNLMTMLKADLQKALEEKASAEEKYASLKERFEKTVRKVSKLKRSRSTGDLASTNLYFLERNILLEPPTDFHLEDVSKNARSKKLRGSRSWPQTVDERPKSPNSQLNALRRDLANVTRKLNTLKLELVRSGVIQHESEGRRLKRKAKPLEEEEEGTSEKSEFRNLKNILQDAKNLNAKLENLREEKERMIGMKKQEEATGNALSKAKEADDGENVQSGEEAFADLMVPFFCYVLSNGACFREWNTDSCEDGSCSNPLKKGIPVDGEI